MLSSIRIPKRFCGPPDSGNGGYTCGLVSQTMQIAADVTLRRPVPMETELSIVEVPNGVHLKNGDDLVAEGAPLIWSCSAPREAITLPGAEYAAAHSPAFDNHPFPTCFTCGPDRDEGDGLRIFPGKWQGTGREYWAAPWVPHSHLADKHGNIRDEFIWAAL